MNSRRKGRRNELKTRDYLINNGWKVCLVKGSTRYARSVDFFGLWDVIALKGNNIKFIQVKTNKEFPMLECYWLFKKEHPKLDLELWVWWDDVIEPTIHVVPLEWTPVRDR
jgi:hypothetical protein